MIRALCALGLIVGTGLASPAGATPFPGLEGEALLVRSDAVIRGRIVGRESRFISPRKIATFYDVEVTEVLAGAGPDLAPGEQGQPAILTVGLPGGAVGDLGQRVGGVPELEEGREYALFLGPPTGPGGARGVVGHALGTYRVSEGRLFADPGFGGHPAVPRRLPALRARLSEVRPDLPAPAVEVPEAGPPVGGRP